MPTERDLVVARARARRAWLRAAEESKRSSGFERLAASAPPELHAMYDSLASSSRRAAERHGASARLQTAWAEQIQTYVGRVSTTVSMPRFLAAVADVVGAASAAVVIWNREHVVAAAMATDVQARATVDIELVVGEGPAHDSAFEGKPIVARAPDLAARWPAFAGATAAMPLHVVAAAPLRSQGASIGALTVFDPPWSRVEEHLAELESVASAVVESLTQDVAGLGGSDIPGRSDRVDDQDAESPLLAEDWTAVVHQAAGMVATQSHCDIATALALINARAFADDVTSTELSCRIVSGGLRLTV